MTSPTAYDLSVRLVELTRPQHPRRPYDKEDLKRFGLTQYPVDASGKWHKYRRFEEPVLEVPECPEHDEVVYGANMCAVLVTRSITAWDVDIFDDERQRLVGLPGLYNGQDVGECHVRSYIEMRLVEQLEPFLGEELSDVALYATHGGYRVLSTKKLTPSCKTYKDVALAIRADERYRQISVEQDNYRLRLTPKPWQHDEICDGWPVCRAIYRREPQPNDGDVMQRALATLAFHDLATGVDWSTAKKFDALQDAVSDAFWS